MIIAGIRPPGFDAARATRAQRAAAAARARRGADADRDLDVGPAETSAVDIAPRPPAD